VPGEVLGGRGQELTGGERSQMRLVLAQQGPGTGVRGERTDGELRVRREETKRLASRVSARACDGNRESHMHNNTHCCELIQQGVSSSSFLDESFAAAHNRYPRGMNHSWADGGNQQQGPGPSRAMRVTLTVLIILSTALGAVWFVKVGMEQSKADCYAHAPAGLRVDQITATARWLPPGYDCSYETSATT
jgi:hypothetical protein